MNNFYSVLENISVWNHEFKKLVEELQDTKDKLAVSKENERRLREELEVVKLQAIGFEDDFNQERQQREGLANQLYELQNHIRLTSTHTDNQMDCDATDCATDCATACATDYAFAGTSDLTCTNCGLQYAQSNQDLFLDHLENC